MSSSRSADDLTEAQQWIVDCIVANGYAVSRDNPHHETDMAHRNTVTKLGLKSKPKRINGEVVRVLVVRNERVFSVYRDGTAKDMTEAMQEEDAAKTVPPLPDPIEGGTVVTPDDCGYPVTFGTVNEGKRSYDWAKNRTLPEGKQPPTGVAAYAVVPVAGMAVIDLDVAKDPATGEVLKDAPTGWDVFNREIGEYGSEDFPKTYLVGTPTGRRNGLPSAHAYYLIPPELQGRLKNAVHEKGMPVDIRCEGKGYVVGAGSHISGGDYLLLDLPDGQPPMMPPRMVRWLIRPRLRDRTRWPSFHAQAGACGADPVIERANAPARHGRIHSERETRHDADTGRKPEQRPSRVGLRKTAEPPRQCRGHSPSICSSADRPAD